MKRKLNLVFDDWSGDKPKPNGVKIYGDLFWDGEMLIRNYYDKAIHERILELGKEDWDWDEETQKCHHAWWIDRSRYFEKEQVLNYTIK